MALLRQARPIMAELVRQARETAYLAVLRRGAVVPVEVIEADRPVRIVSQLGEALPLHSTAAGEAFLAFQTHDDLRALLPPRGAPVSPRAGGARPAPRPELPA